MLNLDPYDDYTGPSCPDCDDKNLHKDEMAEHLINIIENLFGDGERVRRFSEKELLLNLEELAHYFEVKFPNRDLPMVLVSDAKMERKDG
jgi:hypothetical protein